MPQQGRPVSGASIQFREGINATEGAVYALPGVITTDTLGRYTVELPAGYYTAEVSKTGYKTGYITFYAFDGQSSVGAITPDIPTGQLRIVLTWGKNPRDLDSHLTGLGDQGNKFHVYYRNKVYSDTKTDINLDVDDTSSYGPETVTIIDGVSKDSPYSYYIHDYTNRNATNSVGLAESVAKVKVYRGTEQGTVLRKHI